MYIHTYIQYVHVRTCVLTYIHTYIRTFIYIHTYTQYTYVRTYIHIILLTTYLLSYLLIYIHTYIHTHTHKLMAYKLSLSHAGYSVSYSVMITVIPAINETSSSLFHMLPHAWRLPVQLVSHVTQPSSGPWAPQPNQLAWQG